MRIWQAVEAENVKKHLLIVGDITADCAACRELGIAYQQAKNCPGCGVAFHFITSRNATGGARMCGAEVKRIKDRRPDLTFIDYEDWKSITGKQAARDFFG